MSDTKCIRIEALTHHGMFKRIDYKKFFFPAGEMGIELETMSEVDRLAITQIDIDIECATPEDIIELMLVENALDHYLLPRKPDIYLHIPYIPFGRQDRHTTPTSPFSLKVFADIINAMNFTRVWTNTPHSNVSEILINNVEAYEFWHEGEANQKFRNLVKRGDCVLISPDAGAEKRVYKAAKEFGVDTVIVCSKVRNPATGEITGYSVPPIPTDKHLIVLDDICDGGGTFIQLANHLPVQRKSLTLFVVHGIFSKGLKVLTDNGYDEVYAVFDFLFKRREITN